MPIIDIRFFKRGMALSGSTIGIKIADGSYYPVLEEGFTGRKKLVLTTVKDNQTKVQIDLYRGNGGTLDKAQYIGSLIIESINPAPKGKPDVELLLGLDTNGELSAEASDRSTGESQSFSISLTTLSAEEIYEVPEFEMEGEPVKTVDLEEPPLTGETYPVGEKDRRKVQLEKSGRNMFLLILFAVLGIALVAAIAYFVYINVRGAPVKPAAGAKTEATPPKETTPPQAAAPKAPEAQVTEAKEPVAQAKSQEGGVSAAAKPAVAPQPKGGVNYRIKKGDTLWDISSTYYRNPWLYPKLAKANRIKNPDLIFAGTTIFIPEE
jgi:nucleoid-associated protein YgaU